ncbi:50S ribosomal protein L21e [archaeon CG10_big_fil_rev_8_21_14_0_10_43_11]|nr:MAG: 50S ribosomal protein L21e [archaeon CG10_big_fil_rev_8_21_14_0_10_43_11]
MKPSKGLKRRTRSAFRLRRRDRGKLKISDLFKQFKEQDTVLIVPNPSYQRSMPHRRIHGKKGIISGKRGRAYLVRVFEGNKEKKFIIASAHLRGN